jgi:hypothetical protein
MPRAPHHLHRTLSLAIGALAVLLVPTAMHAQALPPTQPTSLPPQAAATSSPASQPVAPPVNTPNHAEVIYAGGQLQVRADNSSLNQILRSISHRTGLKITGGVEEQRVFGNYGPGPVSAVLATLLDGTNTNIFLRAGDATNPPELVLTQRSGGASPPEPTSPTYAMYDDSIDHNTPVAPSAPRNTGVQTPQVSAPIAAPGTLQPSAPGVSPPIVHADASATHPAAASPATVPAATPDTKTPLTPEAVMQQLLKMQQQQTQQKKGLDDKVQKEQIDQQQRLKKLNDQNPPSPAQKPSSQPPTSPTTPQ